MNHSDDKKGVPEEIEQSQAQAITPDDVEVDEPVEGDAAGAGTDEGPVEVAVQAPSSAGRWLPLLVVSSILLLLMALAGYYLWQEGRLQRMELQQALQQENTAQQAQWQQRVEQQQRRLDELATQQGDLRDSIGKAHELASRNSQGWALAEVEYLLLIANHRLQLQQDINTSIAALRLADERLRDLANPALMKVRGEIATEIDALRAVELPDYNGMALQLDALSRQVAQLQTRAAHPVLKKAEDSAGDQMREGVDEATAPALDWRNLPEGVWKELKTLVVIRRHDQKILPMLTPQQEQLLRQGLRLKLEASRIYLLQRDEPGFRQALQGAMDWLDGYFDPEQQALQEMKKSLEALHQASLQITLPNISGSLESLRAEKE